MTKLSDIQLILLSSAAARADGSLLPPPDTVAVQTARIRKAIPPLLKRALVVEGDVAAAGQIWREEGRRRIGLLITDAGRAAIGAETTVIPRDANPPTIEPISASMPATKIGMVLGLLQRRNGATLADMIEATGWLPHTTRAALTSLRKKGHRIDKTSRDGATVYAVEAA